MREQMNATLKRKVLELEKKEKQEALESNVVAGSQLPATGTTGQSVRHFIDKMVFCGRFWTVGTCYHPDSNSTIHPSLPACQQFNIANGLYNEKVL